MLPLKATQILGLGLSEVSPALSFGLDIGAQGEISGVEVVPSRIRVERLSYEEAETRLDEEPFRSLLHLAQRYQAYRHENGAIFIELPEVKIRVVNEEIVIRPIPPLQSRTMVGEAMLMIGEAVARFALAEGIAIPFTTQDPPEEIELPEGMAGMFALRRTLKRSQLKSVSGPHAGLGLEVYAQATSPLRRYSDLVVHQQLRNYLAGQEMLGDQEVLERVGAAEAVASSVRQAERLSYKHWTLVYLMQHPHWHGQGVLVDKRHRRYTVLIPELDLETQIHLRQNLPLDSSVSLTLKEVNLAELEAYFQIDN
jgi:exoribonuclease-2